MVYYQADGTIYFESKKLQDEADFVEEKIAAWNVATT